MNAKYPFVVEMLIQYELAVAALYKKFSSLLPDMSPFWNNLVIEEKSHATVLQMLGDKLKTQQVYVNEDKFRIPAIVTSIEYINKTIHNLPEDIKPINALSLALNIENSIIEHNSFDIFASNLPNMKKEFVALREHTLQHIAEINTEIKKEKEKEEKIQISLKETLFTARKIESSLHDSQFYSVVKSSSENFKKIADAMNKSIAKHIELISTKLNEAIIAEKPSE